MQYENYRNKVLRLSALLSKALKHLALICAIGGTILVSSVTLLATAGLPGKVTCPPEVIYGDAYDCQAKAFLSDVYLQYRPAESEQWTEDQPYLPGDYQVRAVGTSVFGKDRFGKPATFTIHPCPLKVQIGDSSVVFGEAPSFRSEPTKYGDCIRCDGFIYDDIAAASTNVIPDVSKIQVLDSNGKDVTYAYDLQPVPVMLTFQKRPLELLVESTSKIYDGVALTYDQYQIIGGTLGPEDALSAVFTGSQTDAGSSENTSAFTIHHQQNGVAIDVTSQYDLKLKPGILTVEVRPLFISTGSTTAVYTGQPISCQEYSLDDPAALLPGHRIQPVFDQSPTACGAHSNGASFRVYDAQGRDVTDNYNIMVTPGVIEITPALLVVHTPSASWEYDGLIHEQPELSVEGLLPGHKVDQLFAPGATAYIQNVGTVENYIRPTIVDQNGNDVSKNYTFENHFGKLEITPRPITVTTGNGSWVYDGDTHSNKTISAENLLKQHVLGPRNYSVITWVGQTPNSCDLSIYYYPTNNSSIPEDVTQNYDITYVWGTLEITPRPLTISTETAKWIYDGQSHYFDILYADNLAPGDQITASQWASITNVGQTENVCSISMYRESAGPDATEYNPISNYDITYVWGNLHILPRPITLCVQDEAKVYDGTPLYPKTALVAKDSPFPLVDGHTMTASFSGSQTYIGVSNSRITKVKIFAGAEDVTNNYDITTEPGKLVVRAPGESDSICEDCGDVECDGNCGGGGAGEMDAPEESSLGLPEGYEADGTPIGQVKDDQSGSLYLRQRSYGDYTGQSWTKATPYGQTLPGEWSYNYLSSIALRNSGGYIHVAQFLDLQTFMLPYYLGMEGDYEKPSSDIAYTAEQSTYTALYYSLPSIEDGFAYLTGNLQEYAAYEMPYRKYVYNTYLTVDDETRQYMQGIIDKQGFSASDPKVLLKVARYIQNAASYSLEYDRALDQEPNVAIAFLDQYKEGICQHYATAATLLYRTLGIPARYTVGFMVQTQEDTYVDILPKSAHAWVEVYIDGVGWMQIEVTGGDMSGFGESGADNLAITIAPKYTYKNFDGKILYPQQQVVADSMLSTLLDQGYTYEVSISGQQLRVGKSESTIESFVLYDPSGKDVTDEFEIVYEPGLLEVFDRDVQLIRVYLYQLQKFYDGTPLSYTSDDFEIIDGLGDYKLKLKLNISLTEPGELTLAQLNADIDQYATYTVLHNGRDVTSRCRIIFDTYDHPDPAYVPIRVDCRHLELTSASQTKQADGAPLTNSEVYISRGSLLPGHTLHATATGTLNDIGSAANTLEFENIQILDDQGNDVTGYYLIETVEGTLTIVAPTQ